MSVQLEVPVFVYDFTLPWIQDLRQSEGLWDWIKDYCKKWCFQVEKGEKTGYIHYQGRVSLKEKTRLKTLINKTKLKPELNGIHWSVTSAANKDNDFYACKEDTRIDGPWKDTDPRVYIPIQYRIEKLYPWQQYIFDNYNEWDKRSINVIIDEEGCKGKSTIVGYMCCRGLAQKIPYMNECKDIMRMIMDAPKKRCYFIDFPRALGKDKINQFISGIEDVKNGYCYDDRYKFKEEWFDSPNIWIFSNKPLNIDLMSRDRWKLWRICGQDLRPYGNYEDKSDANAVTLKIYPSGTIGTSEKIEKVESLKEMIARSARDSMSAPR